MLDAVSPTELVFAVLVVFFACTVFSAMGFGIGIVGLPLLFLMFDPATSIILLNVMALPVVVLVVLRNREHLRPREIVPIVVAGIVGALIGGWVLAMLDIAEYKDIFGIAVLVVIIALTVGGMFRMPFRMPRASILGPVSGFLVGLFITGIGVGGPLLVLFFVSQRWRRHATRASMALFFIFMCAALIVSYGINDLYTPARSTLLMASIVPALIAALLGDRIAQSLTDVVWRRGVIALVLVSSTFGLALKMWNLVAA
ncbi:MAG: sulfite exporter TauE/SafE family protein [Chloroflexota bacterium]|nr:sulfite exporter TauE/SafE family protein [Chloroflexota bacterium]MDE2687650.1 sulfite exporter TauE/SafE family protein [Chloroflexota bacterium]